MLLVMVFLAAVFAVIPIDLASLYFGFVQALIVTVSFFEIEEGNEMNDNFLVESGTHGVVQELWEEGNRYKCAL